MNSHQLEENLQVIRTLMERSAIYQRALRPVLLLTGSVGVIAAVIGYTMNLPVALFWPVVAAVVLMGVFYLTRRQALKDGEAFWSPPARRVATAMLPMMVAGMALTVIIASANDCGVWPLISIWLIVYGCAIHTAGMFAPTKLRVLGWVCLAGGLIPLWALMPIQYAMPRIAHLPMGFFFGLLHLVFGLIPARTTKE